MPRNKDRRKRLTARRERTPAEIEAARRADNARREAAVEAYRLRAELAEKQCRVVTMELASFIGQIAAAKLRNSVTL